MTRFGCYDRTNLFDAMELGTIAKLEIMRLYPDMSIFTVKAFYEKDEEICATIQESYHRYFNLKADKTRLNLDPDQYREMYWAAEGYLWEMLQQGDLDIDKVEKDFKKLIVFWKSIYQRKE